MSSMTYKKSIKTEKTTVTRDTGNIEKLSGNIYKSVVIMSKRANQISSEIKEDLNNKISEFSSSTDNLEEVFENREQIEIAKYYENIPKPTLIATHEFLNDEIYFRIPEKQDSEN